MRGAPCGMSGVVDARCALCAGGPAAATPRPALPLKLASRVLLFHLALPWDHLHFSANPANPSPPSPAPLPTHSATCQPSLPLRLKPLPLHPSSISPDRRTMIWGKGWGGGDCDNPCNALPTMCHIFRTNCNPCWYGCGQTLGLLLSHQEG